MSWRNNTRIPTLWYLKGGGGGGLNASLECDYQDEHETRGETT